MISLLLPASRLRKMRALEAGKLDPDYELLIELACKLGVTLTALVVRAQGQG